MRQKPQIHRLSSKYRSSSLKKIHKVIDRLLQTVITEDNSTTQVVIMTLMVTELRMDHISGQRQSHEDSLKIRLKMTECLKFKNQMESGRRVKQRNNQQLSANIRPDLLS